MSDFRTNRLFRPGPDPHLNACVGENGGPYDYLDYARGYLRAARATIDSARQLKLPVDIAVYPVVFNFRHGIELALKHFGEKLARLAGETPRQRYTHKLTDNWETVKAFVCRLPALDPSNTVPLIDDVVRDIVDFDPNGQVFRFPEDRAGQTHLDDARIINLGVLDEEIDTTSEVFEFWQHSADKDLQARLAGY